MGTIVFWSYALNWLGYQFPPIRHLIRPRPLRLILDGRPLPQNLRREIITEAELLSQLRLQGCNDLVMVKEAYMESDGRISVVRRDGAEAGGAPERSAE